MNRIMDGFWKLYDKDDHHTHGIYKFSLDEVANALGYWKGYDSNLRPCQLTLHELTNECFVENRECINVQADDDRIS